MEIYGCDGIATFVSIIHSSSKTASSNMHINSVQMPSVRYNLLGGWGGLDDSMPSVVREAYKFLSPLT